MDIKTMLKYLFKRKSIKEPKSINIATVKYFIQGNLRSFAKNFNILKEYILEQAAFRKEEIRKKSPECYNTGKCIYCECSIDELILSDDKCKHGCYDKMLNESEWELYKLENKIKF